MKSMTNGNGAVKEEIGNRNLHYCGAVMRVYRQKEFRKLQLSVEGNSIASSRTAKPKPEIDKK